MPPILGAKVTLQVTHIYFSVCIPHRKEVIVHLHQEICEVSELQQQQYQSFDPKRLGLAKVSRLPTTKHLNQKYAAIL